MPAELLRHYLREYTDGDGCFTAKPSSYVRKSDGRHGISLQWFIVGNEGFCRSAQEFLMGTLGVRQTHLRPSPKSREGIVILSYGGNKHVSRIFHLLYGGATVWLPRACEEAAPYRASIARNGDPVVGPGHLLQPYCNPSDQGALHRDRGLVAHARQHVRVGVQGVRDGRMSEQLLDDRKAACSIILCSYLGGTRSQLVYHRSRPPSISRPAYKVGRLTPFARANSSSRSFG